jgi:hypothetical protein
MAMRQRAAAAFCGAFILLGLLAGCAATDHPQFVTTQQVDLRSSEEGEGVVAVLPRGTPVVPDGRVGGECECWEVSTAQGSGWLYTRFIALK